ncbi:hypothetical protein [Sediminitomix flava]|uniref:Anti-sigma factor n=1 Tax=Sediminitomix flava TaxID=379075 RepID=A0A315ZI17_SEDFL|nr:hypothetical protein [Sediminitomix flava]PWJ44859.1 hypothetical protein BC781_1011245 [Sediminitomix flava]
MDKLERFIAENKDKLDVHQPKKLDFDQFDELLNDDLEMFIRSNRPLMDTEEPPQKIWDAVKEEIEEHELEESVRNQKDEFDVFQPPENMWKKLENEMSLLEEPKQTKEVKMVPLHKVIKWGSSIAAVLILGLGLLFYQLNQPSITFDEPTQSIANAHPELQNAEQYYFSLISLKQKELHRFIIKDEILQSDFEEELSELSASYLQMKEELDETQETEVVIKMMLQNLRLRLNLLDKQLEILETYKNQKKKDESIDI